jgi:hypothetical protein
MGECKVLPQQWIRTRWQTTLLINIQLPKGKKVKPQELIELDCDTRNFVKQRVMTEGELQSVLEKYKIVKPII